jgi:hypothetical protein
MGTLIGHENLYLSIIVHVYEVIMNCTQVVRCVSMQPYRFCAYNDGNERVNPHSLMDFSGMSSTYSCSIILQVVQFDFCMHPDKYETRTPRS